jgi:prepilin-type N-terminal cleavage/methylation domain-containing protein
MAGSATGKTQRRRAARNERLRAQQGFTLVELLCVILIMAIVFGLLAVSITQTRGPAVLVGAGQVASGLSLARQIAVSKGTEARFIIAQTSGHPGMPDEPFRYWSIVSSNRGSGSPGNTGLWTMEKEWEPLPAGVVFLNLSANNYGGVTWPEIPAQQIGKPFKPEYNSSSATLADAWKFFQSFTTNETRVTAPTSPNQQVATFPREMPYLGFTPSGGLRSSGAGTRVFGASVGSTRLAGIRLVNGSANPGSSEITILSTQNASFVEAHDLMGRVTIRQREDYN